MAAYRLHRAMMKRPDCHSRMLVRKKETRDPTVTQSKGSRRFALRLQRALEQRRVERDRARYAERLAKVELFSDDRGWWRDNIVSPVEGFDIIQLHWICQFLNYQRFFASVPEQTPLVWRLADKNPFTGGCHYDGGCRRFETACGSCPKLGGGREDDLSRAIWTRKKLALDPLSDDRLHIVALNHWMAAQVRASSLLGRFECSVIPNGVDLDEFRPVPADAARAALGIPNHHKVVAFVADSASNERKGFRLLLDALDGLSRRRDVFLLVVGESDQLPQLGRPSLQVGRVEAVPFLRQIYSAAHLFVIPSLEDNQPNTVLEAMACGAPVVGFEADGIPEMVQHGKTGLLAECGNVRELAKAIESLLDHDSERLALGAEARQRAERVFSRDGQVDRYLELYHRLLARRQREATPGSGAPAAAGTSAGPVKNLVSLNV